MIPQVFTMHLSTDVNEVQKLYDKFIHFTALVNNIPTEVIADSAANVSIMSLRKAKQLQLDINTEQRGHVQTFNHTMTSLGRVTFNLVIANKSRLVHAYVVQNFIFGLLLDLYTLGLFSVILDSEFKTASQRTDSGLELLNAYHVHLVQKLDQRLEQIINKYSVFCFA